MEAKFWHQSWETNEIGFHNSEVNPLLVKYFDELSLVEGDRVFLPLCGKTRDIAWLLSKGFKVAGAELSEIAIQQLFSELGLEPEITNFENLKHYYSKNIDIFVGDIFDLSIEMLGTVDAVYDRAALVALPEAMRYRYTEHLIKLSDKAPQLLLTFEYEQALMDGPPFSISTKMVNQHYADCYDINHLESATFSGKLKGICDAFENVYVLS